MNREQFLDSLSIQINQWLCENKQSAEDAEVLAQEVEGVAYDECESFTNLLNEQGLERS